MISECLKTKEFLSLFDLEASLKRDGLKCIFLGANAENPRKFFSVELPDSIKGRGVGIISSGLGANPVAKLSKDGMKLLAGHDFSFSVIDLQALCVAFTTPLESVFFSFLPFAEDGLVTILHELGLAKYDLDGNRKWAVHTDVIENFRILSSRTIALKTMGSESDVLVDPETGALSKPSSEGK
jgi:hypothetical protein